MIMTVATTIPYTIYALLDGCIAGTSWVTFATLCTEIVLRAVPAVMTKELTLITTFYIVLIIDLAGGNSECYLVVVLF